MRTRLLVAAAGVTAIGLGAVGVGFARDHGAFGCEYSPRDRMLALRLTEAAPRVRVRIGEGIRIDAAGATLRNVRVEGDAGLAPGTQNGVHDYVYTVTETGDAVITATTQHGGRVSGRVSAHC